MEDLPTEALVRIFGWLPVRGLLTCEAVCRAWRLLLTSHTVHADANLARWVWHKVHKREFGDGLPAPTTTTFEFVPDWRNMVVQASRDYTTLPTNELLALAIYRGHDVALARRLPELLGARSPHFDPLREAIRRGNTKVVRVLVTRGRRLVDSAALEVAAAEGSAAVFDQLLRLMIVPSTAGVSPTTTMAERARLALSAQYGWSLERVINVAERSGNVELVQQLLPGAKEGRRQGERM